MHKTGAGIGSLHVPNCEKVVANVDHKVALIVRTITKLKTVTSTNSRKVDTRNVSKRTPTRSNTAKRMTANYYRINRIIIAS